jgi:hypothetical protein
MFREPLSNLIETISQRAQAIQAFKVRIDLGQLSKSFAPEVVVDYLAKAPVSWSVMGSIAKSIRDAAQADYLIIDIGGAENPKYLTSRLYIFAATIERIRPTRCFAFVGGRENESNFFVGAASPPEVRHTLGTRFPWYEKALVAAFGTLAASPEQPNESFRGGLSDELIDRLLEGFIANPEIARVPTGVGAVRPPGWVELARDGQVTHEHAEWITAALLSDMLIGRWSTGAVAIDGQSPTETIKAVIAHRDPFVAAVDRQGVFKELIDRVRILEQVGVEAAELIEDTEQRPRMRRRKRPSAV